MNWIDEQREQERLDIERIKREEREYGTEPELFICSECKEWTDSENPCCGVGGYNGGDFITVDNEIGLRKIGMDFADAIGEILK